MEMDAAVFRRSSGVGLAGKGGDLGFVEVARLNQPNGVVRRGRAGVGAGGGA